MTGGSRRAVRVGALAACGLLWTAPAFAYIDPNASSIVFQMLAPLAATATTGILFMRRQLARIWREIAAWSRKIIG